MQVLARLPDAAASHALLNTKIDQTDARVTSILHMSTEDLDTFAEVAQKTVDIQTLISSETASRSAADTVLQTNIDSEATSRAAAILLEQNARGAADTTLQTNIDAEATSRAAAILLEQNTRATGDSTESIARALAITSLQSQDTTLQNNINAEAASRSSADLALQTNIDAEATSRAAAILLEQNTRSTADGVELAARTAAVTSLEAQDTVLQNNINAEAVARSGADATLQTNLNSEASSRAAAILLEQSTRSTADSLEISVRAAAVTSLQTSYLAADAVLATSISSLTATVSTLDDSVDDNFDAIAAHNTRIATVESSKLNTSVHTAAVSTQDGVNSGVQTSLNDRYTKSAADTLLAAETTARTAADNTATTERSVLTASVALKATINNPTFTGSITGISKSSVGLGSVDNVADSSKPISTAQQTGLDAKFGLISDNTLSGDNTFGGETRFTGALNCDGTLTIGNQKKLIINNSGNGEQANSYADDCQIYKYNGAGLTIGSPLGKINSVCFSDPSKADRCQIRSYSTVLDSRNVGMHCFANQANTAVPALSICSQLIGINKAQPTVALDVIGQVRFVGLPTSATGLAAGTLYVAAGVLKVAS